MSTQRHNESREIERGINVAGCETIAQRSKRCNNEQMNEGKYLILCENRTPAYTLWCCFKTLALFGIDEQPKTIMVVTTVLY